MRSNRPPVRERESNQNAGFGGVEVSAWTQGEVREAWDGPTDEYRASARVAGRRGVHRSDEAP
jgi:hypothetical protein